ncbi:ParB/RepB/Spo0J family partition protein [Jannaschia sp. Os4]|uniref:ParB/RepB/Spo0J family partition protein n=1 Tax=Jannaschia sp. Os4 TaxID=2807617 RepID=UPI00193A0F2B|nr:ParB/RepB/Spo0J family partition protein [Jannaschia sp. Os4]MBM2575553.1 ParB/RepB/Spo0J family partition protein [Jannaschia sp. Os4]
MADKTERRGLGRGLSALMADLPQGDAPPRAPDRDVPIATVRPNPDQPRRHFDDGDLSDLAASIRTRGVLQPIIVRTDPADGAYLQIIAGERRWRAAQMAGLHEIPVLVREMDDAAVLEVAIVENIQRSDLNPLEEAVGYRTLLDRYGHTQERLGDLVGRSRSHIANALRLTTLPDDVQAHLRSGALTAGHARALVGADNAGDLAKRIISGGLSVRETERLVKSDAEGKRVSARRPAPEKDADTAALERDLGAALRMRVSIDAKPGGEGRVTITYKDLDALDDLCQLLAPGRPVQS